MGENGKDRGSHRRRSIATWRVRGVPVQPAPLMRPVSLPEVPGFKAASASESHGEKQVESGKYMGRIGDHDQTAAPRISLFTGQ